MGSVEKAKTSEFTVFPPSHHFIQHKRVAIGPLAIDVTPAQKRRWELTLPMHAPASSKIAVQPPAFPVNPTHVPKLVRCADPAAMAKKAALLVLKTIEEALAAGRNPVIGCATGSTPRATYAEIVRQLTSGDFKSLLSEVREKVLWINLDTYVGNADYAHEMRDNLFGPLGIDPKNTHIPDGMASDLVAEAHRYESFVRSHPPDLWIVGVGVEGHVAFNEKGSARDSVTRIVSLEQSTIDVNKHFYGNDPKRVPTKALSVGIETILCAKQILFLANGPSKSAAVHALLSGPVDSTWPVTWLREHPSVTAMVCEDTLQHITSVRVPGQQRASALPVNGFCVVDKNNPMRKQNIAVISPHPDDSAISASVLMQHVKRHGGKPQILVATTGARAEIPGTQNDAERAKIRSDEALLEGASLGVQAECLALPLYDTKHINEVDVQRMREALQKSEANIVVIPPPNDLHATHRQSAEVALMAMEAMLREDPSLDFTLMIAETPWGRLGDHEANTIVSGTAADVAGKALAINAHVSQNQRTDYAKYAAAHSHDIAIRMGELLAGHGKPALQLGDACELYCRKRGTLENITALLKEYRAPVPSFKAALV